MRDPAYRGVRDACLQRAAEIGATIVMPLLYHSDVRGVLAIGRKKSGHFYSREDIELLTTMADQAAVAIENATTHQEVVRYAEDLASEPAPYPDPREHQVEPLEVRAHHRADPHRGVAGSAAPGETRGRRLGALRGHHGLHAVVGRHGAARGQQAGGALFRRVPRRDHPVRRRGQRDGRRRADGHLPGTPTPAGTRRLPSRRRCPSSVGHSRSTKSSPDTRNRS